MPLRTIGSAVRFYLTRYCRRTEIGPYVVITEEDRKGAYLTTVSWRESGPEIKAFGSARAFAVGRAAEGHEELCQRVEGETGLKRVELNWPLPAA